jgi:hypothetical protein
MERRQFISILPSISSFTNWNELPGESSIFHKGSNGQKAWQNLFESIADPVLGFFEEGKLVQMLDRPEFPRKDRLKYASLEAIARIFYPLSSIKKEKTFESQAFTQAFENALSQGHPDSFNWNQGDQPLVDAAILAAGFLQNPDVFEKYCTAKMQTGLVEGWRKSLSIKPYESNWLLFGAMVEAALEKWDKPFQAKSIMFAIEKHESWYKGDGWFGDGKHFHFDYYNSIIIHPFLLLLRKLGYGEPIWKEKQLARSQRFAMELERMVSPEGWFPPIGRSLCYRAGLFHHLAFMVSESLLPESLPVSQIRSCLDAILTKVFQSSDLKKPGPEILDIRSGLLRPGLFSFQPKLAENYISTASLYLTLWAFLPLSLPENHAFWQKPDSQHSGILSIEKDGIDIDKALSEKE